jgi:hypothetical protein
MKNQHGLNEEKTLQKKIASHVGACDVTNVVSLGTNNLPGRVCESGEKSDYFLTVYYYGYSLSRPSSIGFTLWIFILSFLFLCLTMIVFIRMD